MGKFSSSNKLKKKLRIKTRMRSIYEAADKTLLQAFTIKLKGTACPLPTVPTEEVIIGAIELLQKSINKPQASGVIDLANKLMADDNIEPKRKIHLYRELLTAYENDPNAINILKTEISDELFIKLKKHKYIAVRSNLSGEEYLTFNLKENNE